MDDFAPPCSTLIPPELADGELRLRAWRRGEAGALVALLRASEASVGRWMSWYSPAYGVEQALHWMHGVEESWAGDGDDYALAVAVDGGATPVGCIGLNQIRGEYRMGNVGYWLGHPYQGRRLMVRALRLFAPFIFAHFPVERLEIVVAAGNLPSRRTAERCGARFEGLARRRLWVHGEPHDAAMYSLLPDDFA